MNNSHKDTAVNFLKMITEGNIRDAFATYTIQGFRHHNPHFKGDVESLAKGMEESHNLFPNKVYDIKNVIEEKNLVMVHGRVQLVEGGKTVVVVHIFRFENDKIVELWDVGEEISKDSPNEIGTF